MGNPITPRLETEEEHKRRISRWYWVAAAVVACTAVKGCSKLVELIHEENVTQKTTVAQIPFSTPRSYAGCERELRRHTSHETADAILKTFMVESSFNHRCIGQKGERGLDQILRPRLEDAAEYAILHPYGNRTNFAIRHFLDPILKGFSRKDLEAYVGHIGHKRDRARKKVVDRLWCKLKTDSRSDFYISAAVWLYNSVGARNECAAHGVAYTPDMTDRMNNAPGKTRKAISVLGSNWKAYKKFNPITKNRPFDSYVPRHRS